jgi:hypothetical protein
MTVRGEYRWPSAGRFSGRLWGVSRGRRQRASIVTKNASSLSPATNVNSWRACAGVRVRPSRREDLGPRVDATTFLPTTPHRTAWSNASERTARMRRTVLTE